MDKLRDEAEKLARQVLAHPDSPAWCRPTDVGFVSLIADALVAFAQQHAECVKKRVRLEGRIEQLYEIGSIFHPTVETDTEFVIEQINGRLTVWSTELAALKCGEMETG